MIKKVILRNFKNMTGEYELTGRDLFVGKNGSGKSAIQQAVALTIQGYLPGGAKKAEDVIQYATGRTMTVGLILDTGFEARRTYTKKRKKDPKTGAEATRIVQDIMVAPSNGETTNKAKEQRIAAELGAVPLMFDFDELDKMSDGKRREFIYNIADYDRTKYNLEFILDYLYAKADKIEDKDYKEWTEATIHQAVEERYDHSVPFEQALESLQHYVTAKTIEYKGKRMEASAASRKLLDYKNELATTDKGIAALRTEAKDIGVKVEKLAREIGKQRANLGELERLREQLQTYTQAQNYRKNQQKQHQGELKELEADLAALTEKKPPEAKDYGAAQDKIKDIKKNIKAIEELLEHLDHLYNSTTYEAENAKLAAQMLKKAQCPVVDSWKCPHDWEAEAEQYMKLYEEKVIEYEKYDKLRQDHRKRLGEIKTRLFGLEHEVKAGKHASTEYDRKVNNLNDLIARQKGILETDRITIEDRQTTLDGVEARIAGLGNVDTDALEKQETLMVGYRGRSNQLDGEIQEKEHAKTTILYAMKSAEEARTADTFYNVYNTLSYDLGPKGIQGEIVKDILRPVTDTITAKLQTMQKFKDYEFKFVTVSATGQEVFRYGWETPQGHLVLYPALSTSEKSTLISAMLTTIIESLDIKNRVLLMDNVENFDTESRDDFIWSLGAKSGSYNNVIVAGVLDESQTGRAKKAGYSVWQL